MNVPIGPAAFVFRHKRTSQIVVAPSERWHEFYDNKEDWEHTASVNACGPQANQPDCRSTQRAVA